MDIHFPRAAVAVLAALVLSGCATSFPTSPDAFRTSATGTVAFRVDQPLAKAFEVVNGNATRCFDGRSALTYNPKYGWRTSGQLDEAGGNAMVRVDFSHGFFEDGVLMVIDLHAAGPSATEILVHRLNESKLWVTASRNVETWFEGGKACWDT
jgi:hypothetical protein